MSERFIPRGVIPAVILPFDSEFGIDEEAFRSHLRDVVGVDGVSAIAVNAHSTETHGLSFDEQKKVLEIAVDEVGDRVPVICGVSAGGSLEGAALARQAAACGAKGLLVLPANVFSKNNPQPLQVVLNHFRTIAQASDLSIIVFNYPMPGIGYSTDTLVRLAEEIPQIVAIKDLCGHPTQHERNVRALHGLKRRFSVLTSHNTWMMSSLVLGGDGLLSGSGSVIADLQVQLFRAIQDKDLARAQAVNDRIWPVAEAFYADPSIDIVNRSKEALVLLGRQKHAYVRPPLVKLSDKEIARIRQALIRAGLLNG
jgi:4-hydroxy-tetrahydrodipicolinate synthase